jgi:hypothetical protein
LSIVVLLLGLLLLVYGQIAAAMWLPLGWRVVLTVVLLSPPAFMMGMCFPLGIAMVTSREARLVPWCWGINGAFSVLATTAALVLALHLGLKAAIVAGIACYVLAGVAAWRLSRIKSLPIGATLHLPAMNSARRGRVPQLAAVAAVLVAGGLLYLRHHERTRFARAQAEHAIVDAGGKLERSAGGRVQTIDLTGCRLDDEGLKRLSISLACFKAELEQLNLAGAPITETGMARLQTQLPNCAIRR